MESNTVLVVTGVLLILLAFAGEFVSTWLRVDFGSKPLPRVAIGVLGTAILAFGLAGLWLRTNTPLGPVAGPVDPNETTTNTTPGATVAITIVKPGNEQRVPRSPVVTGTLRNTATGVRVWLVVNPSGELGWWPQGGPLVPRADGTFEQPVFLGGKPGQRFRIAVVEVPEAAHLAFTRYLQDGVAHNRYPATPLPLGASVRMSVEVVLDPATPS
jgi:hypothetical protein